MAQFDLGFLRLDSYHLLLAAAFATGWLLLRAELVRKQMAPGIAGAVTLLAVACGILGARVAAVWEKTGAGFLRDPLNSLLEVAGSSVLGGWLAALAAILLSCCLARVPPLAVLDALAPGALLAQGVGRIGCFLAGHCYGRPTSLPWGVSFPRGAPPASGPVHPVQLYEALAAAVLFAALWRFRRRAAPGAVFGAYLLLLGGERFLLEFLRVNPRHLGLSQAQWICLGLLAAGSLLLLRACRDLRLPASRARWAGAPPARPGPG